MRTGGWWRRLLGTGLVASGMSLASGAGAIACPGGPWTPALQQVDGALARREFGMALRLTNDAYALAVGTRRWDAMISAGDAYRRIGDATGLRPSLDRRAREAYQKAFFRARQQASVDGVLRATEAYAGLGDGQMVTVGLRVADRLAAGDPEAEAEVQMARARLAQPRLSGGEVGR